MQTLLYNDLLAHAANPAISHPYITSDMILTNHTQHTSEIAPDLLPDIVPSRYMSDRVFLDISSDGPPYEIAISKVQSSDPSPFIKLKDIIFSYPIGSCTMLKNDTLVIFSKNPSGGPSKLTFFKYPNYQAIEILNIPFDIQQMKADPANDDCFYFLKSKRLFIGQILQTQANYQFIFNQVLEESDVIRYDVSLSYIAILQTEKRTLNGIDQISYKLSALRRTESLFPKLQIFDSLINVKENPQVLVDETDLYFWHSKLLFKYDIMKPNRQKQKLKGITSIVKSSNQVITLIKGAMAKQFEQAFELKIPILSFPSPFLANSKLLVLFQGTKSYRLNKNSSDDLDPSYMLRLLNNGDEQSFVEQFLNNFQFINESIEGIFKPSLFNNSFNALNQIPQLFLLNKNDDLIRMDNKTEKPANSEKSKKSSNAEQPTIQDQFENVDQPIKQKKTIVLPIKQPLNNAQPQDNELKKLLKLAKSKKSSNAEQPTNQDQIENDDQPIKQKKTIVLPIKQFLNYEQPQDDELPVIHLTPQDNEPKKLSTLAKSKKSSNADQPTIQDQIENDDQFDNDDQPKKLSKLVKSKKSKNAEQPTNQDQFDNDGQIDNDYHPKKLLKLAKSKKSSNAEQPTNQDQIENDDQPKKKKKTIVLPIKQPLNNEQPQDNELPVIHLTPQDNEPPENDGLN